MPSNYPSPPHPSGAQSSDSGGPFYNQSNENERAASPLPHDIHHLRSTSASRASGNDNNNDVSANTQRYNENAENAEAAAANPQGYASHPEQGSLSYSQQPPPGGEEAQPATQEGLPPQTSPERLAHSVLSMSEPHSQQQLIAAASDQHPQHQQPLQPDSSRKRTKISRACDECRRKKIRCDSVNGGPNDVCSNCIKTGAICQFSRQPMKRGPSKGYIKELADRLNTLEYQLTPVGQMQGGFQYPQPSQEDAQEYESSPSALLGMRKRKHPMGDGPWQQQSPKQARQANMIPEDHSLHGPHAEIGALATSSRQDGVSGSGVWRANRPDVGQRDGQNSYVNDPSEFEAASTIEWNEAVVDEYYRLFQSMFPLLPHSKIRLRARLSLCPETLRDAFLTALETLIRTSPASTIEPVQDVGKSVKNASELIAASQFESLASRTVSANIIYIQTLILMALESDNHGPATLRGQVGPPRAEWLGRAVGMATHLKLDLLYVPGSFEDSDPDTDEKVGRRVWWILFVLDRWHASSTSSLPQLPESGTCLLPEDQIMLGENTYHLARLSYILGHISTILQQPPSLMAPGSAAAPIITTTILGETDRFRESIECVILDAPNLIQLAYWHVRLMVLRLTSSTKPQELLVPAARMASILNNSNTLITPLNHHFAALSAMTLAELSEIDETSKDAEKGIDEIIAAIAAKRGFMTREDSTGWDSAIKDLATKNRSFQRAAGLANAMPSGGSGSEATSTAGLQHLADAAMSGNNNNSNLRQQDSTNTSAQGPEDTKRVGSHKQSAENTSDSRPASSSAAFDPTTMPRYGYLTGLVQNGAGAAS